VNQTKKDFKGVWTLGEVRGGSIHPVSFELLAWGRDLADKLGVTLSSVIIGSSFGSSSVGGSSYEDESAGVGSFGAQAQELIYHGAERVYMVDHPLLAHFRIDSYARILVALVGEYRPEILIASATTTGRTLMPVCAVKLEAGLTADCTGLDIDRSERLLVQTRPAIGGNIMATIKTPIHRPQMATVRPKSKRPLERDPSRKGQIIKKVFEERCLASRIKRLDFVKENTIGAPIQDAEIIVSFGKGLKSGKHLELINQLAGLLGGSVGASRKAVDGGWISYSHQVGLSGKTVSPRLYIACGISGAVQHLAGMSSAETVIAINSDPEADIFKVADYGIVGDIFEVVPLLIEKLRPLADT
jgi:electron transfer flavoprotein alpha subunit